VPLPDPAAGVRAVRARTILHSPILNESGSPRAVPHWHSGLECAPLRYVKQYGANLHCVNYADSPAPEEKSSFTALGRAREGDGRARSQSAGHSHMAAVVRSPPSIPRLSTQ
jgi:hypothetical protein